MTKNEYLIELATRLQALTNDPNSIYPELSSMISFYQEMLEDITEDGLSEEEAVAAMESPDEIVGRLKTEFGEPAPQASVGAPEPAAEGALNAVRTEMRLEYGADEISLVRIIDSYHAVRLITGGQLTVNYEDDENGKYDVSLANGVLTLTYIRENIREKRSFLRSLFGLNHAGWNRMGREVTVEMPENWNGSADIRTFNAAIVASAAINKLIARTSNGAISLENMKAESISVNTSNGRIVVDDIRCDNAKLSTSNAPVNVHDAKAGELYIQTGNGGIWLDDVAGEKLHVQTSNASIRISDVDASDVTLISSNGSVIGSLAGSMEDYAITSHTSNGLNSLPNGTRGEKMLVVHTSNGNIAVDFEG